MGEALGASRDSLLEHLASPKTRVTLETIERALPQTLICTLPPATSGISSRRVCATPPARPRHVTKKWRPRPTTRHNTNHTYDNITTLMIQQHQFTLMPDQRSSHVLGPTSPRAAACWPPSPPARARAAAATATSSRARTGGGWGVDSGGHSETSSRTQQQSDNT